MKAKPKEFLSEPHVPSDETALHSPVELIGDNTSPVASPAIALQYEVERAFAELPVENRWSIRRSAGFLLLCGSAFWIGAAYLINLAL